MLLAVVCLVLGYLGISLIVMPDVGPAVPNWPRFRCVTLVGQRAPSGRCGRDVGRGGGARWLAAVLLMRAAVSDGRDAPSTPRRRRRRHGGREAATTMSERGMWDALDEGRDPTEPTGETEGR